MPYIGKSPEHGNFTELTDVSGSFNGSTTQFALTSRIGSIAITPVVEAAILISINGVIQEPTTDYTVSGTNITFTSAPASTDSFFGIVMGRQLDVGTPSDSTVTPAKMNISSALVPASADGAALGSTSAEWSDLYLADSGVIYFGNDQEITLTHAADDGLILKHVGTGDGKEPSLTFQAGDNDIAANDVLGSIFFQAPDEGAGTDAILVAAGIEAVSEGDFSSSNNATKLSFKTAASEAATEKMSLSSAGLLTIADDLVIKDGGTIGVSSDADSITIASNGAVTFSQTPVFPDGSIALADLDIDGGTDIGANIVDADLFIIDDGAGGTNRKTTASRIKTYIGTVQIDVAFESSAADITADSVHTFSHSLGVRPTLVEVWIKCTDGEQGWATGDYLILAGAGGVGGTIDAGISVQADATNVEVILGSCIRIHNQSTFNEVSADLSKWDFVVTAYGGDLG